MTRSIELKLPSGRTIYAEVDETPAPRDVGFTELSSKGPGAAAGSPGLFADSVEALREMLETTAAGLDRIGPRRPDTVTLELSVELASGGVVKLLGGSAKGGLKVSMTWKGTPGSGS